MALTYTPSPDLGKKCPEFSGLAVDGETYSRRYIENAPASVIMFICNHCPYVQAIEDRLIQLGNEMGARGVKFLAISSNDASKYPSDSYENLKQRWNEKHYPFPYIYDESQKLAKDFGAVCTPDFFVFDHEARLTYRGRLDDSWKDAAKITKQELRDALIMMLNKQSVPVEQPPSMGCSIKWLPTLT
jgi:thiol-disulfide isomerase/thioredoxin